MVPRRTRKYLFHLFKPIKYTHINKKYTYAHLTDLRTEIKIKIYVNPGDAFII